MHSRRISGPTQCSADLRLTRPKTLLSANPTAAAIHIDYAAGRERHAPTSLSAPAAAGGLIFCHLPPAVKKEH
jgi:hypothetical protein